MFQASSCRNVPCDRGERRRYARYHDVHVDDGRTALPRSASAVWLSDPSQSEHDRFRPRYVCWLEYHTAKRVAPQFGPSLRCRLGRRLDMRLKLTAPDEIMTVNSRMRVTAVDRLRTGRSTIG